MGKLLISLYGLVSYVIFLASFLYAIGFVGNFLVPRSIDSGLQGSFLSSLIINAVLLGLFAVPHSVMARPWFKKKFIKVIPASMERSTYVLLSSLLLFLLYWLWQPMTDIVWHVESSLGAMILWAIFAMGWLMVLLSTFMINHFDLFGLRQVYLNYRDQDYEHLDFKIVGLYKLVRHPIMLGFIIAFWATPVMTVGHLVFAIATTAYIFIALQFEERDLVNIFGEKYKNYQDKVSMVIPLKWKGRD